MSYRPILWKNAYSLDFTAQTTQNIKTGGDGTKTIAGLSWTFTNSANCNTADVTNGTGFVLAASNANVNYSGATRNAPILTIPVTTVFPNYNLFNLLRVQARILLTNNVTNFEFVQFGLEYVTTPTAQNYHCMKGFNTTPNRIQTQDTIGTSTTIRQISASTTDDILCVIYRGPINYLTQTGAFSATPMNSATDRVSGFQPSNTTIARPSDVQIFMSLITLNTQAQTDGFKATWTHLQVDYADGFPLIGGF